MIANPSFIHNLLSDVILRGATAVDKRKLLFALGAKQDRASAWERLLETWEDMDQPRHGLRGYEVWGTTIVLVSEVTANKTVTFEKVASWAE